MIWKRSKHVGVFLSVFNPLTPNDPYSGRTAPLTSKCWILYIYSTNTVTEYFKHGRPGNRTRDLMISRQRLRPLDHEAGQILKYRSWNWRTILTSSIYNDLAYTDGNTATDIITWFAVRRKWRPLKRPWSSAWILWQAVIWRHVTSYCINNIHFHRVKRRRTWSFSKFLFKFQTLAHQKGVLASQHNPRALSTVYR